MKCLVFKTPSVLCPATLLIFFLGLMKATDAIVTTLNFRYRSVSGYRMNAESTLGTVAMPFMSPIRCALQCSNVPECRSANLKLNSGTCSLSGSYSWATDVFLSVDSDNIILQPIGDTVNYASGYPNDWILAFRGTAGIGQSVYDAWMNTGVNHDQPIDNSVPLGCMRLDAILPCDMHFRSNVLNMWSSLSISHVLFGFYVRGKIHGYIMFNGQGSSVMNWFSASRISASPWPDLASQSFELFSISGDSSQLRRFFVNENGNGYNESAGWMVTVDCTTEHCSWANPIMAFPSFLYSQDPSGPIVWETGAYGTAEVMVIFVLLG